MPTTTTLQSETASYQATGGRLRKAMTTNAVLSLATGALLAVAPATIGSWLDVSIDGWFRLFGLALIGHAAILLWAQRRPDVEPWARLNLAAIAPYPIALVAVLGFGLVSSNAGRVLLLVDGTLVGAIAVLHWLGLRTAE